VIVAMTRRPSLLVGGVLVAYVTTAVTIAATEGFVVDGGPPWPIIVGFALPIVGFLGLLRSRSVRDYLLGFDPRLVVAVQLWRVIGAAFLFGWVVDDLAPGFAIPAGLGDVVTGVAALALLSRIHAGTLARRDVVLFSMLGVGDFAVALAAGGLVRPEGLATLPWVLFPVLAAPIFAMVHVLNWIQLTALPSGRPAGPGRG